MEVKKQNHEQEFKVDWKKDYTLMTHEEKLELMKLYASCDENSDEYGFTDIYEEASEDDDMLNHFLEACNHQDPKTKPLSERWTGLWMFATYD